MERIKTCSHVISMEERNYKVKMLVIRRSRSQPVAQGYKFRRLHNKVEGKYRMIAQASFHWGSAQVFSRQDHRWLHNPMISLPPPSMSKLRRIKTMTPKTSCWIEKAEIVQALRTRAIKSGTRLYFSLIDHTTIKAKFKIVLILLRFKKLTSTKVEIKAGRMFFKI